MCYMLRSQMEEHNDLRITLLSNCLHAVTPSRGPTCLGLHLNL